MGLPANRTKLVQGVLESTQIAVGQTHLAIIAAGKALRAGNRIIDASQRLLAAEAKAAPLPGLLLL